MILESERLRFRDHEVGDLEAFCAMEADPEVRRYVGGAPRSREAAEEKFRRDYLPGKPQPLYLRAAVWKADGRYAGYCGVYPHFVAGGAIEGEGTLAYYFAREFWGRGLATEAGRFFVEWGFGLGLTRMVAAVEVGNAASVRVLEKLGFRWVEREVGARMFEHFELRNRALCTRLNSASDDPPSML